MLVVCLALSIYVTGVITEQESRRFTQEHDPESALRPVQEPIKSLKGQLIFL